MKDEGRLIYGAAGTAAAILLGVSLIPLREATTAANLAFPFLILTIVVAEFGGRGAAVVTAVVSSLSLNFFLTKPYMTLAIEAKHDVIAFAGLTVCGLVVAGFGSTRGRTIAALTGERLHLEVLRGLVRDLAEAAPAAPAITRALNGAKASLPLEAAVVRDDQGRIIAASDRAYGRPVPAARLSLEAAGPFPADGARLPVQAGLRRVGWLDVWGDGSPATPEARRALEDVARLIGMVLSR